MKMAVTDETEWSMIGLSSDAEMVANEDGEETIIDVPDDKLEEIKRLYAEVDKVQLYLYGLKVQAINDDREFAIGAVHFEPVLLTDVLL